MFSPGIEPGTFRVLGGCDNHFTTKTLCMMHENLAIWTFEFPQPFQHVGEKLNYFGNYCFKIGIWLFVDSQKDSESTGEKGTQVEPLLLADQIFAVYKTIFTPYNLL